MCITDDFHCVKLGEKEHQQQPRRGSRHYRPIGPIETRTSSMSQKTFNALAIVRGCKTPPGTDSVCTGTGTELPMTGAKDRRAYPVTVAGH